MLAKDLGTASRASWKDITPGDLHRRLDARDRPRVIDVREPDELVGELGHIEGIEHVPLATVPARCEAWSRDDEIVVVCRSSGRSAKAAEHLAARGFTRIHNMVGGMLAWNAAALPIVSRKNGR
jgi:hydroxyacylglutathione hydrolase